jgi:hypothetical protein
MWHKTRRHTRVWHGPDPSTSWLVHHLLLERLVCLWCADPEANTRLRRILHSPDGRRSAHLVTAATFYDKVRSTGGKALFCCVAGQNRSAALAVAVQLLDGLPLEHVLRLCSRSRPWILENVGFQRQLVELEEMQRRAGGQLLSSKRARPHSPMRHSTRPARRVTRRSRPESLTLCDS